MVKAIFLDRDGIVNRAMIENGKPYPPLKVSNTYPVKGIKELVDNWHKEGYLVIVVTNQPDAKSGLVQKNTVEQINKYLKSIVNFDDIFVCWHTDKDQCKCRKPKAGLLLQAQKKYNIDFAKSYMIGDRWKDIEAGKSVGCKTIFVDYHYNEKQPEQSDYVVENVLDISIVGEKE